MSQPVGALQPSALWTDARVFASTFLDLPPSFSWRAGPSVNGGLDMAPFLGSDPSWLAAALFTPPPPQQQQQQHTGTQASRNSAAGVSERSAETERQKAETRRLYSRDELLAFRQQQQSGHTLPPLSVARAAALLSTVDSRVVPGDDDDSIYNIDHVFRDDRLRALTASSDAVPGDIQAEVRNRQDRVRGLAKDVLNLSRAARGAVALFRLRFFVEMAQSHVVNAVPAAGERLRCFIDIVDANRDKGPHHSVLIKRSAQKQLMWWSTEMTLQPEVGQRH